MPRNQPSCHPLLVHCKHDKIVALDAHDSHPKNDNVHTPDQLARLALRNAQQSLANLEELKTVEADIELAGFTELEIENLSLDITPDDLDDGFDEARGPKGRKELGDTQVQVGEYRIPLARAAYLAWQEALRHQVGFEKSAALSEIKRRLKL